MKAYQKNESITMANNTGFVFMLLHFKFIMLFQNSIAIIEGFPVQTVLHYQLHCISGEKVLRD